MDIYVTSAFSKNNSGGNKAGVVFDSFNLTTKQKMEITKELGFSENICLNITRNKSNIFLSKDIIWGKFHGL